VETATVTQARPWAFWSPSRDELIAAALDLAGVGNGTRFLDLGCGDGRVLVAAAGRGAEVRGVEIDPVMAAEARRRLEEAGVSGTVEVGDMFSACLDADVIYAYLTPVTLSLLREHLESARPGTRIVTPRYPVSGWQPNAVDEVEAGCFLYEAPVRSSGPAQREGWASRASVVALPADRRVLIPLTFTAGPGRVSLELEPALGRACHSASGAEPRMVPGVVPVDLIFKQHGAGSVIAGSVRAQGREMTLAVVFARSGFGQWNFGPQEGAEFRARLDSTIGAARGNAVGVS
jgi:SAM-dependent methyltransferase